jgi:ribonuclease Z
MTVINTTPPPPNSRGSLSFTESNPLHNALRQVSVSTGAFQVAGFSISGLSTYIQVPELDLCFDMGECPLTAISLNHVFLTHAHGDHSRCLMRHDSLRKMMGVPTPATYYIPQEIYDLACTWIRAEALFEGVSETRFTLPNLEKVVCGEKFPLRYRKDLYAQAFPVKHSIPTVGYTIFHHKRKLRDEYLSCTGNQIMELRLGGTEVTREVFDPKISFTGDCLGETLWEQRHIWDSETVVCECTFLEDDEEPMARKKGHTHLAHLIRTLQAIGPEMRCQRIILSHFSMKYSKKQILGILEKHIPPEFKNRVIAFI